MSIPLIEEVFAASIKTDALETLILVYLAKCFNEKNGCYPSSWDIARKCKCDRRSVTRVISRLEEKGLILRRKIRKFHGDGWSYELTLPSTDDTMSSVTDDTMSPVRYATDDIKPSNRCHSVPQRMTRDHPKYNIKEDKSVCAEDTPLTSNTLTDGVWFSQEDVDALAKEGIPRPFIRKTATDWKNSGGKAGNRAVTRLNATSIMRKWWECERNKDKYIQEFPPVVVKKRASTPDEWAQGLCAERCNNFDGTKCRVGYTRRPEDDPERPRPPEECPHYVAKGDDQ